MSERRNVPVPENEDEEDGLNIISGDDEDEGEDGEEATGEERTGLFEPGMPCDRCNSEPGAIGLDPTCRGAYDGEPQLFGHNCARAALTEAYSGIEGVAAVVEPFGEYSAHYYYRLHEMPSYRFVTDDIEALSWLMLALGGDCDRCGNAQSRFAWLSPKFVDQRLPEDKPVFRNMDGKMDHLCAGCAAAALAGAYKQLSLPLITVELPRGAMGLLIPTGD